MQCVARNRNEARSSNELWPLPDSMACCVAAAWNNNENVNSNAAVLMKALEGKNHQTNMRKYNYRKRREQQYYK